MDILPLKVVYNPYSVANIFSLVDVNSQFIFNMDNNNQPAMFVHTGPDSVLNSYQFREVLYYFDTYSPNVLNNSINYYYFLSTIQEYNKFLHRYKIEGAYAARILQCAIVLPYRTKFKIIFKFDQLQNCPITVSDIDRADAIYGLKFSILKVKSVCKFPGHVENIPRVPLPSPIENQYNKISLIVYYIFINSRPYSLTKSAKINFHYIQACTGQGKLELNKGLDIVKQTYKSRGFGITQYHGDNQFNKIISHLLPYILHICAADEHIGGIENAYLT